VSHPSVLRADGRVSTVELFFDLVYVFAVTQISHLLLEHPTLEGALQATILLLALWWAWIDTAWVSNWYDPRHPVVRVLLLATMGLSLGMAAAIPEAFGDRGLMFAVIFVTIQVGRPAFVYLTAHQRPVLRRNFQRILAWACTSGLIWLAGGFAEGDLRLLLWTAAALLDTAAPAAGFWVPRLGRSSPTEWDISGHHLAERCQLFLIIALGESILVTGATFAEMELTVQSLAAAVVAFTGSVAMWWIYFARSADWGAAAVESDPGRLGRAFTYFHIPMVAGIIVSAVADEMTIAHPDGHIPVELASIAVAGPALFLAGHQLYKWAITGRWMGSRLAAIVALAVTGSVAIRTDLVSPLALSAVTTGILIAVAVWDWLAHRGEDPQASLPGHA
jgi:low temperature requirement protein LtrA